ncbi:MFS transporter [Kaistia sp. 32K]|uniref:MFS transporter n=1 Tax=Kaistia sp. 32K TaxID=2795690 RepID=UPI0019168DA3|nr:MFS transporter [Kaistia sp. 32K]BCP54860.1 MFS transporter [Kaistia sp. 32K]
MTAQTSTLPHAHPLSGRREQFATRAVFLVAGLGLASWAPLVPFAKARLGVDDAALGILLLCLGLGSIVAMPITGALASRLGCRTILVLSALVFALVIPWLVLSSSVLSLAIALILFGASIGTFDVAMNIQAVMVEKDSGRHMMSGFHGLFSLGGMLGAGGVSLLLGTGLAPLSVTLMIGALLIILVISAYSGLLPYGNREAAGTPLFVLPRGIVIFIGALCFIVFLAEGAVLDWSALFLISSQSVEPSHAGFGYTMFAVAMTLGRLTGDRIVRAVGGTVILVAGGILSAAGFLIAVFAPSATIALAGFLLVGLGASNIVPVLFTAAGRQTSMPASLAVAAITTLGYAGILLGPAAIGFVAQHLSIGAGFVAIAVGLLVVGIAGPAVYRR